MTIICCRHRNTPHRGGKYRFNQCRLLKRRHLPRIWKVIFIQLIFWNYFLVTHGNSSWLFLAKIKRMGPYVCEQMPIGSMQREICTQHPKMMKSVGDGAGQGIIECQHQFRNEMWNCSIAKGKSVFGKFMNIGSREVAFINAMTSASVMYAVIKACSRGDFPDCACDPQPSGVGTDRLGQFEWGGCNDDIKFGRSFVEKFVDSSESNGRDPRSKMNLHNNMAGRKALERFTFRDCQCHGVTGSCAIRTCWNEIGKIRSAGDYLKKKYQSAYKVKIRQEDGGLQPETDLISSSSLKKELVYLDESPSFCNNSPTAGVLGTIGRRCNVTSSGSDSCDNMCCGRGYVKTTVERVEKCRCKFKWCCDVICKKCNYTEIIHTCKDDRVVDVPEKPVVIVPTKRKRKRKDKRKKKIKNKKRKKKPKRSRREVNEQFDDEIDFEDENTDFILSKTFNEGFNFKKKDKR